MPQCRHEALRVKTTEFLLDSIRTLNDVYKKSRSPTGKELIEALATRHIAFRNILLQDSIEKKRE